MRVCELCHKGTGELNNFKHKGQYLCQGCFQETQNNEHDYSHKVWSKTLNRWVKQ